MSTPEMIVFTKTFDLLAWLLPAFGTMLAIIFLGETFQAFHATGIAIILAGVLLATLAAGGKKT